MTVSNAYNRPDQLSPDLRDRVLRAARELGSPGPNPLASTLRRGRVGAVGMVFPDRQVKGAFLVTTERLAGYRLALEAAGIDWMSVPIE